MSFGGIFSTNYPTVDEPKKPFKFKLEFAPIISMKKGNISKKTILKSIAKMVADKEMVRFYIKGKTPLRTLFKMGIKLAKPL